MGWGGGKSSGVKGNSMKGVFRRTEQGHREDKENMKVRGGKERGWNGGYGKVNRSKEEKLNWGGRR